MFALEEGEARALRLGRFAGRAYSENRAWALRHRGWSFHEAGGFMRALPRLSVHVELDSAGRLGPMLVSDEEGGPVALGRVDAVLMSELLRDLAYVAG